MFKLYLDLGHGTLANGRNDLGAVSPNGVTEAEIVLDIGLMLEAMLKDKCHVLMSRWDNVTENGINARAIEANEWGADMVLSLHCNSFSQSSANGTEALILSTGGMAEMFAGEVVNRIVPSLGTWNRGVKVRSDLGILRKTDAPAVLAELAFLSNAIDEARLVNQKGDFAMALFESVKACASLAGKPLVEAIEEDDVMTVKIGESKSVPSVLIDGVTYVPLREILEAIKLDVTWSPEEGAKVVL